MNSNYRVKYKNGSFEVEIESSDKSYVDSKLAEFIAMEESERNQNGKQVSNSKQTKRKGTKATAQNSGVPDSKDNVDVAKIVAAINDDDEYDKIEEHILNKSGQLPRIIMCLYHAESADQSPITTGSIQTITDQLGIKITNANAAKTIKNNLKYFVADSVRKKGAIMKYKLNRKGNDAFQKLLNGERV